MSTCYKKSQPSTAVVDQKTFISRLPYEELGFTIIDVIYHATVLEIICQISLKRFKALGMLKKIFVLCCSVGKCIYFTMSVFECGAYSLTFIIKE
jgi:hypothetical protein